MVTREGKRGCQMEAAEAVAARKRATAAEESHEQLLQALASVEQQKGAAERALQVAQLERGSEVEDQRRQIESLQVGFKRLKADRDGKGDRWPYPWLGWGRAEERGEAFSSERQQECPAELTENWLWRRRQKRVAGR